MKVAIVGVGELGSALGQVLAGRMVVDTWDVDPSKVPDMKGLRDVIAGADVVFCAVPSFAMRRAVLKLMPFLEIPKTVVVSMAKGIESPSRKTMDEVMRETLPPAARWGVIGGPMLAGELSAGKPSAAIVASRDESVRTAVRHVFENTKVVCEASDDVRGVALGGVLKNVYAVAMGLAAGLAWGSDETGWLAARAMEEMVAVGRKLGAGEETMIGTAGFADFLATAYSKHSRNRRSGVALASGNPPPVTGEGVLSLPPLLQLLGGDPSEFPVLAALIDVIIRRRNARQVFEVLFSGRNLSKPGPSA